MAYFHIIYHIGDHKPCWVKQHVKIISFFHDGKCALVGPRVDGIFWFDRPCKSQIASAEQGAVAFNTQFFTTLLMDREVILGRHQMVAGLHTASDGAGPSMWPRVGRNVQAIPRITNGVAFGPQGG